MHFPCVRLVSSVSFPLSLSLSLSYIPTGTHTFTLCRASAIIVTWHIPLSSLASSRHWHASARAILPRVSRFLRERQKEGERKTETDKTIVLAEHTNLLSYIFSFSLFLHSFFSQWLRFPSRSFWLAVQLASSLFLLLFSQSRTRLSSNPSKALSRSYASSKRIARKRPTS